MKSLIKLALLFLTTLTFIACSSSGGDSPPAEPPAILPKISIADATGSEGGTINFKVTSDITATVPISFSSRIEYQTASQNDLTRNTTPTQIEIGQNSTTISVTILNDEIRENAETFTITLMNPSPSGTTITRATATGTIATSDSVDGIKTKLSISKNTQASEGESINFKVTSAQAIAEQISFDYRIDFDSTQTLNSASTADLSGNLTGTMQANIATNDTSTTISIATENDSLREKAESFSIIFSNVNPTDATFGVDNIERGTIIDNDNNATGIVIISVADATASEASSEIVFRVSSKFSAVTGSQFTFDYEATVDNSISANTDDFTTKKDTATIPAGQNSATISIRLENDTIAEPNETFSLRLTNPSANVILANSSAKGTILNDDVSNVSNATAMLGDEQITLNWTNPVSNLFAGVTITQRTGSTAPAAKCTTNVVATITNASTTSHNITALANGTTHSFRICARSTSGNLSSGVELANLTLTVVDQDKDGLIEITTATQLNNIRYNPAGTSYKTSEADNGSAIGCPNGVCSGYELMNNIIDLSSDPRYSPWTPIGNYGNFRNATFDGNNKTISGLKITGNPDNAGLFSIIQDASIGNLKLATVDIAGGRTVGALVGFATGSNTLSNIELIRGSIAATGSNLGGLVGSFSGTITDSSSSLTVIGHSRDAIASTGGLVGRLESGSIKNSNSSGSVSASNGADTIGGLVGYNNGAISNSWASGTVSSTGRDNYHYGGLVGGNNGNISNSWASGEVSNNGDWNLNYGGLVGQNNGNISNSWASGEVSSNGGNVNVQYGGLVGSSESGTISNSWASGEVTGAIIGGLVGVVTTGGDANKFNGRNYQLAGATGDGVNLANDTGTGDSFVLGEGAGGNNDATGLRALEMLSGATNDATSDYGIKSNWHAGFDLDNADTDNNIKTGIDLETRYCDTNGNGKIDDGTITAENPNSEQIPSNTVWVMAPNDVTTAQQGGTSYYQIPAIRCIGDTKGKTTQEITDIRQREIDRQRHLFPR